MSIDIFTDCEWEVTGIKTKGEEKGVAQTYWKVSIGEASFAGATPLAADPSVEGFIPFAELTEEMVLCWIKNEVKSYADHVARQLERQLVVEEEQDLPWAPPTDNKE